MSFDHAALTYDHDFTHTLIAQWLRERVWTRLSGLFQSGMRVLELGCGTGEDAVWMAQRGIQVIATDASPEMLRTTTRKSEQAGLSIQTQLLDFNQPSSWQLDGMIDGAYSNFGALNCTRNWSQLAAWLADRTQPGAKLGFAVMGRFCLWETLWHGLHLDWRTASRRWSGKSTATLANGSTFPVYYPSIRKLISAFSPYFQPIYQTGLGVFLPPSDSYPIIEKRPRLQRFLTRLEDRAAHRFPFRAWGDHFWLELVRI